MENKFESCMEEAEGRKRVEEGDSEKGCLKEAGKT